MEVCAGSNVSSLTVSAVDILNANHSTSCSVELSDTIVIGRHCILASFVMVIDPLKDVKSSPAESSAYLLLNMKNGYKIELTCGCTTSSGIVYVDDPSFSIF